MSNIRNTDNYCVPQCTLCDVEDFDKISKNEKKKKRLEHSTQHPKSISSTLQQGANGKEDK